MTSNITSEVQALRVRGPAGELAVYVQGDANAPVVFMAHSILSASLMWDAQAALLAANGWRAVRADTRGHGASDAPATPTTMDDLVADTVAVLDALHIAKAHYVGLSLGGMSGFGLGIAHPERVHSLCLCDARADMPPTAAAVWPERVAIAQQQGCTALAAGTIDRWFGRAFCDAHPDIAQRFNSMASSTSTAGFVGCAQAIMGLDYLAKVGEIKTPTTMIVGENDGPLPQAMHALRVLMPHAALQVIEGAGHLPNIDQPAAFNTALLHHLSAQTPKRPPP